MKLSLRKAATSIAAGIVTNLLVVACGADKRDFVDPSDQGTLGGGEAAANEIDANEPCITETLAAEPVPLAMLIVIDRSGSMAGTKWDQARNAMIAFADSPGAAGSKLGLSIFPPDSSSSCELASFAPIVPIGPLPDNALLLKNALVSRDATGGTPMVPALQAGVAAMKSHLGANPNEEGVLILVTDGEPSGCSSSLSSVVAEVSAANSGTPSIRTFAVGMEGAKFSNLDQIATAGGSTKSYDASGVGGGGMQQQLFDALDAIRSGALGCEYILPAPPPDKGVLDPASVQIEFTPGKNDPTQTFKHVTDPSQCGATTGGFHYDDPANPKRIILCPASCEAVKGATAQATVNVFLGCIKKPS